MLFGSERSGLSNPELDHCHALLRIPTAADAPSMNLGQAVALTSYEFSKARLESGTAAPDEDLASGAELEGLVETALLAMEKARVNTHMSASARRDRFRAGLMKWRMSRPDVFWLRGLLSRLLRRP